MIKAINVLDSGGLVDILPKGHTLEVDSGLVLLVGENGEGKTATLRLINTSLEHRLFFNAHGISQSFHERDFHELRYDKINPHISEYLLLKLLQDGPREGEVVPNKQTLKKLIEFQRLYHGLFDVRDALQNIRAVSVALDSLTPQAREYLKTKEWVICSPDRRPSIAFEQIDTNEDLITFLKKKRYKTIVKLISLEDLTRIQEQMKAIAQRTDLPINTWGYLKLDLDLKEGGDVYVINVPSYGEFGQKLGHGGGWGGDKDTPAKVFMHFKPDYKIPTPGMSTKEKLEKYFADIREFFEQHLRKQLIRKIPRTDFTDYAESSVYFEFENAQGPYVAVQKQASPNDVLVVLMDEPTVFLSYRNKYWFREQILGLLRDYSPRLQIFIATNDPILIERTPDAGFIDMYSKPAQFSHRLILDDKL